LSDESALGDAGLCPSGLAFKLGRQQRILADTPRAAGRYLLFAFNFAQRFLWAAAILARPASEIVRPPLDPPFKLLKVRIAFSTCRSCPSNRLRWFFNSFTAAAIDMIVPLEWNCSRVHHPALVKALPP
jgi:hypothetical protein